MDLAADIEALRRRLAEAQRAAVEEAGRRQAAEAALRASEERLEQAFQRHADLLAELQHRVRNIMAMIRAITRQTAQTTDTAEEMAQMLEGRINALARTQAQLTRAAGAGLDLEMMVREELLSQAADETRVEIEGPEIELAPKAAEVLSLALHELATNSTRFGALGQNGRLKIVWGVSRRGDQDQLSLNWRESGVPIVSRSARRSGFGTELIEARVPYELNGEGELAFRPGGVEAKISFPLVRGESVLDYGPQPNETEGE